MTWNAGVAEHHGISTGAALKRDEAVKKQFTLHRNAIKTEVTQSS